MGRSEIKTIIITGPTASGKTALAVDLAKLFNGEIVSADSRQVYKWMDIGTGKDIEEYHKKNIPYHLIDIVDPIKEEYNLMRFCKDARERIEDIHRRNKLPFIVGGSPLYIHALIADYLLPGGPPDPAERKRLKQKSIEELNGMLEKLNADFYQKFKDKQNINRLVRAIEIAKTENIRKLEYTFSLKPLILGIYYPREVIRERIRIRLEKRLKQGMIEEVIRLHKDKGISWDKLHFFGLEYRYIALYLQDKISMEEMKNTLLAKIRQFARRQDIWFRKMEREGFKIHWLKYDRFNMAIKLISSFISTNFQS